jgi:hypothetical protein
MNDESFFQYARTRILYGKFSVQKLGVVGESDDGTVHVDEELEVEKGCQPMSMASGSNILCDSCWAEVRSPSL